MSHDSRTTQLVLASGSPRRKELLGRLGVEYVVDPADVEERPPELGEDPTSYARWLAQHKASTGARRHPDRLVLGADTVVTISGLILGKPCDEEHALRMLRRLQGQRHRVVTAVTLCCGDTCKSGAVSSEVRMKPVTETELRAYVATGEPMDKAGAYALQGLGGQLIDRVSGCYNNVVGLPLCLASSLLRKWGIDLQPTTSVDPHLPLQRRKDLPS